MKNYTSQEFINLQNKIINCSTDKEVISCQIEADHLGFDAIVREGNLILKASFGYQNINGILTKPTK